jgi:hypothetical protein
MNPTGEVTVQRDGKTYGAAYSLERGMVIVKAHTEPRFVELVGSTPEAVARRVLNEIIDADRNLK